MVLRYGHRLRNAQGLTLANCFFITFIYSTLAVFLYLALFGTVFKNNINLNNYNRSYALDALIANSDKMSIRIPANIANSDKLSIEIPANMEPKSETVNISSKVARKFRIGRRSKTGLPRFPIREPPDPKKRHRDFSPIMETPPLSPEEIANYSNLIRDLNEQQLIKNLDIYGPLKDTTNVLVIQTHTRLAYLSALIESLSNVRGINDSLLIFSHDVITTPINDKIQGINFTRVMQIFYPHSIQLHPDRFPGPEPEDKVRKRWNPFPAQIKLHWWWKLNFVFDQIKILRNFSGVISFTEEDTYFTPDALWVLNQMKELMIQDRCGGCEALSIAEKERIGTALLKDFVKARAPNIDFSAVFTTPCTRTGTPSNQLAFNRTLWEKLKKCSVHFCEYDDYNWDWTLAYLSADRSCMKEPLKFYVLKWPRVFHTGNCGFHHNEENCNPSGRLSLATKMYKSYGSQQFPVNLGKLEWKFYPGRSSQKPRWQFGGMGNPKVVELCKSIGGVPEVTIKQ